MLRRSYRMTVPMMERGEVAVTVPLSPTESRLMAALIVNRTRYLTVADLIECVWPNPDAAPEWEHGFVKLMLHRLRRKGILIENVIGIGYRLA